MPDTFPQWFLDKSASLAGDPFVEGHNKGVKKAKHEYKEGKLKSGAKSQKKVTNPKRPIAVGLSKAHNKGDKVSAKKAKSQPILSLDFRKQGVRIKVDEAHP